MNITAKVSNPISFEQYVAGQFDCPWSDCVWVNGEIVEVPPETGLNNAIAAYLFVELTLYSRLHGLDLGLCHKDTDIEVNSSTHQTRKPDVMVLSRALKDGLWNKSSVVRLDMEPPLLVVEVISKKYRDVDLVAKAKEYGDRQVPEYWTVDWDRSDPCIIIRVWNQDVKQYTQQIYHPGDKLKSSVLPHLSLPVDAVLVGGR